MVTECSWQGSPCCQASARPAGSGRVPHQDPGGRAEKWEGQQRGWGQRFGRLAPGEWERGRADICVYVVVPQSYAVNGTVHTWTLPCVSTLGIVTVAQQILQYKMSVFMFCTSDRKMSRPETLVELQMFSFSSTTKHGRYDVSTELLGRFKAIYRWLQDTALFSIYTRRLTTAASNCMSLNLIDSSESGLSFCPTWQGGDLFSCNSVFFFLLSF